MFSAEALKILKNATRMMYYSGAVPLTWSTTATGQNRLFLKDSKKYRLVTTLHCAVLVFYNAFMTYRFGISLITQKQINDKAALSIILQIVWNLLSYSLPLLVMVNNFMFWKDIPNFINALIEFFERFGGTYIIIKTVEIL